MQCLFLFQLLFYTSDWCILLTWSITKQLHVVCFIFLMRRLFYMKFFHVVLYQCANAMKITDPEYCRQINAFILRGKRTYTCSSHSSMQQVKAQSQSFLICSTFLVYRHFLIPFYQFKIWRMIMMRSENELILHIYHFLDERKTPKLRSRKLTELNHHIIRSLPRFSMDNTNITASSE